MRIPIFFGVSVALNAKQIFQDAGATVTKSTAGGWELRKGAQEALVFHLGNKTIGGTKYQVFTILVYKGDVRKSYRWLKANTDIVGPYTLANAPTPLKNLLIELSTVKDIDGNTITPGTVRSYYSIAGEDLETLDQLTYTEGNDENGRSDKVTNPRKIDDAPVRIEGKLPVVRNGLTELP